MFTPSLIIIFAFSIVMPFIKFIVSTHKIHLACNILSIIGFSSALIIFSLDILEKIRLVLQNILPSSNPYGIISAFDSSEILIFLVAISLGLLTSIYSLKYMERDSGLPIYYSLLFLNVAGILGLASSYDFFTLFVFWELMCVSSYMLVAFRKSESESIEAGIKYTIMSSAGSATILFGLTLIYTVTGTLNFQGVASALKAISFNPLIYVALVFLLVGFGIKTALFPLHTWLPDAYMAAPSSISAFMSGIVTVTGLYAMIRSFSVLSYAVDIHSIWLISVLSVLNMFFGNIAALLQDDLKRMLAYSSIAHVGYMLIGVSVWTLPGITASLLHLFNHAFIKCVSFFCAGAFVYRLGTRKLAEMHGVGRVMPLTTSALIISLLSSIGMPPLNGFISKLYLFLASMNSGMLWLGLSLVINSAISAGYYLRIIRVLMAPKSENMEKMKEAPIQIVVPIYAATVFIIFFGLYPDPVFSLAQSAASHILSLGEG
ncbi:MAG: proton-conducting transporter membrane subunit [Nitrososphaerota archaeon]